MMVRSFCLIRKLIKRVDNLFMKHIIAFFLLYSISSHANETCSRVAVINYQEVLVDTSSTKKGEGLRYYLNKDERAKELLDEYQEKIQPSKLGIITGSVGSAMILAGVLQTSSSGTGITSRNTLLYSGLILSGLTYITTKTINRGHEKLLEKAVDQYNRRNLPRIYFSPFGDNDNVGVGFGLQQEF